MSDKSETFRTMQAAIPLLADLGASFEYPGYIAVSHEGFDVAFGDITGDYSHPLEGGVPIRYRPANLPASATPEELAKYIRQSLERLVKGHPR